MWITYKYSTCMLGDMVCLNEIFLPYILTHVPLYLQLKKTFCAYFQFQTVPENSTCIYPPKHAYTPPPPSKWRIMVSQSTMKLPILALLLHFEKIPPKCSCFIPISGCSVLFWPDIYCNKVEHVFNLVIYHYVVPKTCFNGGLAKVLS